MDGTFSCPLLLHGAVYIGERERGREREREGGTEGGRERERGRERKGGERGRDGVLGWERGGEREG